MEEKMLIRDTPKEERPRERFLQEGPKSLSNQELLALLIRTGTKNESVIQLSSRLIRTFEGLRLLKDASIEEITAIHGIGEAKAIQILAAIEIGRRINSLNNQDRYVIRSPEDCANYCMDEMRFLSQEHFVCLYLNTKNQVLHKQTILSAALMPQLSIHARCTKKHFEGLPPLSFVSITIPREIHSQAVKILR